MRVELRWFWFALAVVAVAAAARMTRYAPVSYRSEENVSAVILWDRWTHRMCFQLTEVQDSIYGQGRVCPKERKRKQA